MKKHKKEWPQEVRDKFKRDLRDLVDRSGYSIKIFSKIYGISPAWLNAWISLKDEAMPSVTAYELLSMSHESEAFFTRLIKRRERFLGETFPEKSAAGRPKLRGREDQTVGAT